MPAQCINISISWSRLVQKGRGKKTLKSCAETNPAVVNAYTEERYKAVASIFEENGWKYAIGLEPSIYHTNTGLNMEHNYHIYPKYDRKSKKKKIGDIAYDVVYAILFVLLGATFFLSIK